MGACRRGDRVACPPGLNDPCTAMSYTTSIARRETPRPVRHLIFVSLLIPAALSAHQAGPFEGHRDGRIDCRQSVADEFGCQRIDMLAHLSLDTLAGGTAASDIWGWVDAVTGREYVLIGTFSGTIFVDIGNPETPVRLGMLPGHDELRCARSTRHDDGCGEEGSAWRDIKVYADHAYVVSEAVGHGMQVFDLRQLRTVKEPTTFAETAWLGDFGAAHNVAINEETGFAYVVGSDLFSGGPLFVDIRTPARPQAVGGYSGDGYTHDAQCVVYRGPDADYAGREICFLSNEDTVTLLDVTDKRAPLQISRRGYSRASYTHQGWLDESHRWFYVNDETDELRFGGRTTTYIWDMNDLDAPELRSTYSGLTESIDHNNYAHGRYLYQSNYTAGLRILDISTPDRPLEVAWFDSFPIDDHPSFNGTWSNYPFFPSGVIALSDKENGLFLLRLAMSAGGEADLAVSLAGLEQPDAAARRFRYDALVTNNGTAAVDDVIITHVLAESDPQYTVSGGAPCRLRDSILSCNAGTVDAGDTFTMTVTQDVLATGQRDVEVQASAADADPQTANNKASGSIVVTERATPAAQTPVSGGGGGGVFLWGLVVAVFARKRGYGRLARVVRQRPVDDREGLVFDVRLNGLEPRHRRQRTDHEHGGHNDSESEFGVDCAQAVGRVERDDHADQCPDRKPRHRPPHHEQLGLVVRYETVHRVGDETAQHRRQDSPAR